MNTSKISVIIPIYNVEEYLAQCLESVVSQSYKNLEIICVDDCSKDNSISIVKSFMQKDNRIKLICHKSNKGLAVTRNTGLKSSSGEYIFFLDSDDYLFDENILEKLYRKILQDNTDIAQGKVRSFTQEVDEEFKLSVKQSNEFFQQPYMAAKLKITPENFDSFYDMNYHTAWGRLIKKDFLISNNITFVDENLIHEDEGFFIKIYSNFPQISCIEDPVVMYRKRKNSLISNMTKKENKKERLRQYKSVLNDAISYIEKRYDEKMAQDIIKKIKYSDFYSNFFAFKIPYLIFVKFSKSDKKISVFNITLYREKIKNEERIYKVFGIPVKKEPVSPLKPSMGGTASD